MILFLDNRSSVRCSEKKNARKSVHIS